MVDHVPTDLSISCHESEASESLDCMFSARKKHIQDQKPVPNNKLVEELIKKQRGQKGESGLGREAMVFCTRFLAELHEITKMSRNTCWIKEHTSYIFNTVGRSFDSKYQIIIRKFEGFLRSLFTWVFTIRKQHNTMFSSPSKGLA